MMEPELLVFDFLQPNLAFEMLHKHIIHTGLTSRSALGNSCDEIALASEEKGRPTMV